MRESFDKLRMTALVSRILRQIKDDIVDALGGKLIATHAVGLSLSKPCRSLVEREAGACKIRIQMAY